MSIQNTASFKLLKNISLNIMPWYWYFHQQELFYFMWYFKKQKTFSNIYQEKKISIGHGQQWLYNDSLILFPLKRRIDDDLPCDIVVVFDIFYIFCIIDQKGQYQVTVLFFEYNKPNTIYSYLVLKLCSQLNHNAKYNFRFREGRWGWSLVKLPGKQLLTLQFLYFLFRSHANLWDGWNCM